MGLLTFVWVALRFSPCGLRYSRIIRAGAALLMYLRHTKSVRQVRQVPHSDDSAPQRVSEARVTRKPLIMKYINVNDGTILLDCGFASDFNLKEAISKVLKNS